MKRLALAVVLLAALAAAALIACATNPATGRSQLILVSADKEREMGLSAVPGVMEEFGAYDDPALAQWVAGIGKGLAAKTERPELPYQFTVLDSPVVNAFALPGGPTFVTRGLIAHADSEAELAGVMGHEIGHVVARHGAEQASRGQLLNLGLGAASIARPELQRFGQLLGAGAQMLLLRYSRDAEREADMLGVRYIGRAGYEPTAMSRFLGVLDQLAQESGKSLPGWLSTHPDPGERVATTLRLARAAPAPANPRVGREELLARVDGLVFGDDPRQGFQKGLTFHHPQLRFRFDLPEGWKAINTRAAVAATDDEEKPTAQLALRLAPADAAQLSPAAFVERLKQKNPNASFDGAAAVQNGVDAWRGAIVVHGDSGATRLSAVFARVEGRLYQFLGATSDEAKRPALDRALRSLRPETDPAALGVRPVVVRLAKVPAGTALPEFCAQRKDLGAPCKVVGDLNHLPSDARAAGTATWKYPVRQSAVYP